MVLKYHFLLKRNQSFLKKWLTLERDRKSQELPGTPRHIRELSKTTWFVAINLRSQIEDAPSDQRRDIVNSRKAKKYNGLKSTKYVLYIFIKKLTGHLQKRPRSRFIVLKTGKCRVRQLSGFSSVNCTAR